MIHPYTYTTAENALQVIKSGDRVFVHGSACTPLLLLQELAKQKNRLENVEIVSITLQGDIEIAKPGYENSFHINSLFVSEPIRLAVKEGRADFIPAFLSDIPSLSNSS
jgi:acyl-CoA hydrolase